MSAPTPEMIALARRVADEACEPIRAPRHSSPWEAAYRATLAMALEITERAAKMVEWAHMVPPDGGSPTPEECDLVQSIATALRRFEHVGREG